jgi:hypothetical protein
MHGARHVMLRAVNPRISSYMASYDVASTIHQSLGVGAPGWGAAGAGSAARLMTTRACQESVEEL